VCRLDVASITEIYWEQPERGERNEIIGTNALETIQLPLQPSTDIYSPLNIGFPPGFFSYEVDV
jgi:hypothetical protein